MRVKVTGMPGRQDYEAELMAEEEVNGKPVVLVKDDEGEYRAAPSERVEYL